MEPSDVEMHTAPEESSPILPLLRDDYTYKPMCHMSTHAHHDMVHTQVHKTIRLHICLLHICMRMRQRQMSRYHIFSIVISSTSPQTVQTIVLADFQGDELLLLSCAVLQGWLCSLSGLSF
jgi:hypothetical protein